MRLKKLTVDNYQDEEDFRLKDDFIEDSTEQMEPKKLHVKKVNIMPTI